jgi:hypothetical protein
MSAGRNTGKKASQQPSVSEDLPKMLACRLNGVDLNYWFEASGDLCVVGPPEAQETIDAFVYKYRPLLNGNEVDEFIDKLELLGREHRPIKKFAILDLVMDA